MPSQVFISCGLKNKQERDAAMELHSFLKGKGFVPYLAIVVQSIPDLNQGIINQLKRSDYYIFINFRREKLSDENGNAIFRGSLFSNQELAIAYSLGFDNNMILLNQKGTERNGMFGTIVSNSPEFDDYKDLLNVVKNAIEQQGWTPMFSRNLVPVKIKWAPLVKYDDHSYWVDDATHSKMKNVRNVILVLENRRSDRGAIATTMRLKSVTDSTGKTVDIHDSTPLKVTSHFKTYNVIIWPNSTVEFDLLAFDVEKKHFYLNSLRDINPRKPVISTNGESILVFQTFADGFPILDVNVSINVTNDSTAENPPEIRLIV
jgi:hypothetical protein